MKPPIATISAKGPYKCPYCTGDFSVAEEPNPAILHSMPYCKAFESISTVDDAIKFMRAAAYPN